VSLGRVHGVSVGLLRAAVVLEFAFVLGSGVGGTPTAADTELSAPVAETVPYDTTLSLERNKATMVLVLDAGTPSAEVTLGELRRTIAGREETLVAHVVFVVQADEFVPRAVWGEAASIPGVHVLRDTGGAEARRHSATSGTSVLYRADRRLLFRGASMQGLPPLLDHPATNVGVPGPKRKDAAQRRPGPLDDWVDSPSGTSAIL
jgi:hypothetical protein